MMKNILFFCLCICVLFVPLDLLAQANQTVTVITRGTISSTGQMPNWISSLGTVFLDALSPLAYSMSGFLVGLVKTFIYIFLTFYIIGLGINLIRGKSDFKATIPMMIKRFTIIAISILFLNIPQNLIYENTVNPILQVASRYTTGFLVNADPTYAECIKKYSEQPQNNNEVLTAETKAHLVCPINTSAKQIDVMTRMGTWFIGTAVTEYITNMVVEWALKFIPVAGKAISKIYAKTVSKVVDQLVYILFTVGIFLLTQGFALAIDILWTLLKVIMQITLPIMMLPLGIFSYAYEEEESGYIGFATGWRKTFLTMFENGVLGFLFWSISVGILGIFLQYIFNGLVIHVPNLPALTTMDLMNSSSVFYDANGEIKDSTIFGLVMSFHNPANIATWVKFLFSFKMAIMVFEIFKKEGDAYIQDNFVNEIKTYADTSVKNLGSIGNKYQKGITDFAVKFVKSKK